MVNFKTSMSLAFIATSSAAYADSDTNYQMQDMRSEMENARIAQSVDMQNMQNQMNSMDAPAQPVYVQPSYQPLTADTAYGTMYVGPGSGFQR